LIVYLEIQIVTHGGDILRSTCPGFNEFAASALSHMAEHYQPSPDKRVIKERPFQRD
jgi:hypothetical protein